MVFKHFIKQSLVLILSKSLFLKHILGSKSLMSPSKPVGTASFLTLVCFIITLLLVGPPLEASPPVVTVTGASRTANIKKQGHDWLLIDKGWVHGVNVGMEGLFQFADNATSRTSYSSEGLFVVTKVYKWSARLKVKEKSHVADLTKVARVLFRGLLVPRDPGDYPYNGVGGKKPPTTDEPRVANFNKKNKDSFERYLNYQIVEYSGKENQFRAVSQYGTVVERKIMKSINKADYKVWTMGKAKVNDQNYNLDLKFGPCKFRRNLSNEKIEFNSHGFKLTETVLNQTIMQVDRGLLKKGSWQKTIRLDSMGAQFPQKIEFHFEAYPAEFQTPKPTFIIRCTAADFSFKAPGDKPEITNRVLGRFSGILVYSPQADCLYQTTSVFEAEMNGERMKVEECRYLVDADKKKVSRLLDLCGHLGFTKKPVTVKNAIAPPPMWAVQAAMVQRVASLSGFCTAERGTNSIAQTFPSSGVVFKITSGMETNSYVRNDFRNEIIIETPDLVKQGMSVDKEIHFDDMINQFQEIFLYSTISDVFNNAAKSTNSTVHFHACNLPNTRPSPKDPNSLNSLENRDLQPSRQPDNTAEENRENVKQSREQENRESQGDSSENEGNEKEEGDQDPRLNKYKNIEKISLIATADSGVGAVVIHSNDNMKGTWPSTKTIRSSSSYNGTTTDHFIWTATKR